MTKVSITELIVLKASSEATVPLQPYTIMSRYKIDPISLSSAVNKLTVMGFLELSEEKVRITTLGIKWITENSDLLRQRERRWKKIPDEFCGPRMSLRQPYVPMRALLDDSLK